MTQPTDRPGIDQLTSDMLDQLYDELWHLRLAQAGADLALQAACRMTEEQRQRAENAQAERDQLRADLDWAREQTLAAQQEATEAVTRADRHEATLTAVRDELAAIDRDRDRLDDDCDAFGGGYGDAVARVRAVLDQHDQTTT